MKSDPELETDPDPLVRDTDPRIHNPYPHQKVTDPQQCLCIGPDPDPAFHFHADPDSDPDPSK